MSSTSRENGPQGLHKAAILMISLGEQTSAEIVQQMTEDEVATVSQAIARQHSITSEQAATVLEEFQQLLLEQDYIARGGIEYARKMLTSAFAPEVANRALETLQTALENESVNFESIQKADPQQLAKFIHAEHPQTVALLLSRLNPFKAAALLQSLPAGIRANVALRMANLEQISPAVISKIAGVIGQKLTKLGEVSRQSYGGVRAVAEIFNRLDSATSSEILAEIGKQDTNLFETIRHLMFAFEDVLSIDNQGVKEIVSKADRKALTLALKGTSEQLQQHIMKAMSQRGAEMLKEDMEALGPVKIREVEAAQQSIVNLVRQLEEEGVLTLRGGGGDEYIV